VNGYKTARLAAIERDGGRCLVCGASDGLTVHHLIPHHIVRRHRLENLRTLCEPCHFATEQLDLLALYIGWLPYLIKDRRTYYAD
jgi:5-methylcytosine-specific restriction endonuclease McrA